MLSMKKSLPCIFRPPIPSALEQRSLLKFIQQDRHNPSNPINIYKPSLQFLKIHSTPYKFRNSDNSAYYP